MHQPEIGILLFRTSHNEDRKPISYLRAHCPLSYALVGYKEDLGFCDRKLQVRFFGHVPTRTTQAQGVRLQVLVAGLPLSPKWA